MPIVLLKEPSLWDTLPSGLLASGDALGLDNLVAEDFFDGAAIDADLWDAQLVQGLGAASIVVANGYAKIKTTTADAAAILTYKSGLDRTKRWRIRFKVRAYQNGVALTLQDDPGYPVPGPVNTWHLKTIFELAPDSAGKIYWGRWNPGETQQLWESSNGWETPAGRGFYDVYQLLWYEIESDGTDVTLRLLDADGNILVATPMPWSDTRAQTDFMWAIAGDPFTNIWSTEIDVYEFRHYGPYPSGLVATMGQRNVGQIIENIPITESAEAGASIAWRHDKDGAGFVMPGGGTLAELKAALVGEFVNTLDLEATFTSDGAAHVSLDINGGVIAGYGAAFNLPLEVVELPGLEVIEI